MEISRRHFMVVAAASASACAGIASAGSATAAAAPDKSAVSDGGAIDAGSLASYPTDQVYDSYRENGFFIIRRDKEVFALSSVCTHRGCKVHSQQDMTYLCKCHGSRFDKEGKVTQGPATRNLPRLTVAKTASQHLLVNLSDERTG